MWIAISKWPSRSLDGQLLVSNTSGDRLVVRDTPQVHEKFPQELAVQPSLRGHPTVLGGSPLGPW